MERERDDGVAIPVERHTAPVRVVDDTSDVRVVQDAPDVRMNSQLIEPRDRIRWGPVWAGFMTTITTFLLLELLAFSLGWLTVDVDPAAANSGGPWASIIIGLIAFFAGGWVAGATAALRGSAAGLMNGLMVWALSTVVILVFSVLGGARLFGALGSAVGSLLSLGALNQLGNIDPTAVIDAARTGAWWGFWALFASAGAATLGGWLGIKSGPLGRLPQPEVER